MLHNYFLKRKVCFLGYTQEKTCKKSVKLQKFNKILVKGS